MAEADQPVRDAEWQRVPAADELAEMLEQARCQGLLLSKTPRPADEGLPGSWLGGEPTLPATIEWPTYQDENQTTPIPLHFLAQIDLSELPQSDASVCLPNHGTLFFFVDPVLAPQSNYNAGGYRAFYVEESVSAFPKRDMPPIPDLDQDWITPSYWYENRPTFGYSRWNFTVAPFDTFQENAFQNAAFQTAAYKMSRDVLKGLERQARRDHKDKGVFSGNFVPHHMFGTSNDGEPKDDLVRLLAVRTDPDIGFEQADDQGIAFYISQQNLEENRFSDIALIEEM